MARYSANYGNAAAKAFLMLQTSHHCFATAPALDADHRAHDPEQRGLRYWIQSWQRHCKLVGELTHQNCQPYRRRRSRRKPCCALSLKDKAADSFRYGIRYRKNLAVAQRWLGDLTDVSSPAGQSSPRLSPPARRSTPAKRRTRSDGQRLQWNIADLALARYRLDPDPAHLA